MKVRELIAALKSADPDGAVWLTIEDDEWPATVVTTENRYAYTGCRALRICRGGVEIPRSETVLHDDTPPESEGGCTCNIWQAHPAFEPPGLRVHAWCPLHGGQQREDDKFGATKP